MTDQDVCLNEVMQRDLIDIQQNLNALVRQLNRGQPKAYHPIGAAAIMAAMAFKLTQLSRTLSH